MFTTEPVSQKEISLLLSKSESHYLDFKAIEISGASLQKHICGLSNADGGELYVGVKQSEDKFAAEGFDSQEDANQLIQSAILDISPTIEGLVIDFLVTNNSGLIVRFVVPKSPNVHYTSSGDCYVRLSAQTQKIKGQDIASLAYSKGFFKYEEVEVSTASIDDITEAGHLNDFMNRIGSNQEPHRFLRRNNLLNEDNIKVNVGCVLLFDDDPDEVLSSKVNVKIVRMLTTSDKYKRDQMSSYVKMSGPLETLISEAEESILKMMKNASFEIDGNVFDVKYPV